MLRLRVASAAVLVPLLLAVLVAGQPWLTLVIGIVAVMAASEIFDLLRRAGFPVHPWIGIGAAIAFVLDAWLYAPMGTTFSDAIVGLVVIVSALAAFAEQDPRQGSLAWFGASFGAVYAGLAAYLVRIAVAAPDVPAGAPLAGVLDGGRVWLLVLVLAVWTYDTAAYVAGRAVGRGRFLAHISPSKTWSGVVGGTLATLVVTAALVAAAGRSPLGGVVLGALIAVAAQAGDVAESMLKRAAGAKDSGTLIPGHGGMLDRIDSFLFAAPAAYVFLVLAAPGL